MTEKIIGNKKNGMSMMLLLITAIIASAAGFVGSVFLIEGSLPGLGTVLLILCILVFISALICLGGLKVLKPQEALVLTLFGNYYGTLKGEGFYWIHPFATAVNPAAHTVLNQSGDVKTGVAPAAVTSMKMSLKIMTLSNNKQKINDCLGNPVEIGIAVMWRVVDTAKACTRTRPRMPIGQVTW